MQSFRFFHSFITINSIVMPTHRKSTGTTPFDSQTLGELYETYAPQLLRICLRYVKNRAEAEDVLHDAFVIIFTHIDHLRDETKLVHWMTVIVRNLALRQAKATEERRRLRETLTDETAALDNDDPTPEISTERLLQAIDALPRGYGEVFRLAVLDGLTHDEIGQLLGIAPHSSSSQLARAKRMLRKWLTDYRLLLILPVALGVWLYRLRNVHRPPAASMASLPVSPARKAPLRAAAASAAARKERGTGGRSEPTKQHTAATGAREHPVHCRQNCRFHRVSMHSSPPKGPIRPYPLRRFPPCRATATVSPHHTPSTGKKFARSPRPFAISPSHRANLTRGR